MSRFAVLLRRELAGYFAAPFVYVMSVFFLAFTGLGFWLLVALRAPGPAGADMVQEFFTSMSFWIALVGVVPLITMRLIAEEKRTGTIETLMTAPVSATQVVLAKYVAAFVFFAALWMPTLGYFLVLRMFNPHSMVLDAGRLASAYFGVLMVGTFLVAIGLFASSLTGSQAVAAMIAFSIICVFFLVGFLASALGNALLKQVAFYIASVQHMFDFAGGTVDSRPCVFYLSGCCVALVATVRFLDAGRAR